MKLEHWNYWQMVVVSVWNGRAVSQYSSRLQFTSGHLTTIDLWKARTTRLPLNDTRIKVARRENRPRITFFNRIVRYQRASAITSRTQRFNNSSRQTLGNFENEIRRASTEDVTNSLITPLYRNSRTIRDGVAYLYSRNALSRCLCKTVACCTILIRKYSILVSN